MARLILDATHLPENHLVRRFFELTLIRRRITLDDGCGCTVEEIRKDPRTGEKQRLTYTLDTHAELH